jgi:hypothetical protein
LNLSVPELYRLGRKAGVKLPPGNRKWDLAWALADLPQDRLEELASEWLYAGQTSATWVLLSEGTALDVEKIKQALTTQRGKDPFSEDARPSQVTLIPQLVDARQLGESKIVLTFVVRSRLTTVLQNFEPLDVIADEFFVGVLRTDQGVLEIRASHERAILLANTWLVEFAELVA